MRQREISRLAGSANLLMTGARQGEVLRAVQALRDAQFKKADACRTDVAMGATPLARLPPNRYVTT